MQRLILMRHGKAERSAASGEDFDRALEPRGVHDAALIGEALRKAGLQPDLALVSAAQRTRQTWQAVSASFPQAKADFRRDLYHASADRILQAIEQEAEGADTVMAVGHNPGMHILATELARQGSAAPSVMAILASRFPTSTAVAFRIDEAGRAHYDGLFLAKEFGGGGRE